MTWAQAAASSPTSSTRCWCCATSDSGRRRRTKARSPQALEKRPNQAPLLEALKATVAYQRKIQAQAAAQQEQGANPGFAIGGAPAPSTRAARSSAARRLVVMLIAAPCLTKNF